MKSKELRLFEFLVIARQILLVSVMFEPQLYKQYEFLQTLEDYKILSFIPGGLVILLGLYFIDGMRVSIFPIVFSETLITLLRISSLGATISSAILTISLISTLLAASIYYFFPVIRSTPLTGKYKVGYKGLLKNRNQLALFYPTLDPSNSAKDLPYILSDDQTDLFKEDSENDLQWKTRLLGSEYFLWLYKNLSKMPRPKMSLIIPQFVLKTIMHFITKKKMGIIHNAAIAQQATIGNAPLVIYSHGLSSNMNYQASFCKELASKGLIVASMQHHDEVQLEQLQADPLVIADYISTQHRSVLIRRQQIRTVIDEFMASTKLSQVLPGAASPSSCIVIGHSYGGQTAALCALSEDKISSGVLLDPVMNLFEVAEFQSLITQPLKKPLLLLASDHFDTIHPYYSQILTTRKFIAAQKSNSNKSRLLLPLKMKNTEHCDFIDIALLQPREMQVFRKNIYSPDTVQLNHMLINKLVELFLAEVMRSQRISSSDFDGDKVIAQIDDFCKNTLKVDNPFQLIQ